MTEQQRPSWAVRLQAEREARGNGGWSKYEMARRLLNAAPGNQQIPVESLARQIRDWERGKHFPRDWQTAYAIALGIDEAELFGQQPDTRPATTDDAWSGAAAVALAAWLEQSNIGPGTINYLAGATRRLSFDYARRPPLEVLDEARGLQRQVTELLRGGRQRVSQTTALLEISAELFALANLLAGDVGRYPLADAYGHAAWTCADEGDSNTARALVLCAQSKTARWDGRHADAAVLARRGFEISQTGRPRVLLAVCEATALQSCGDIDGARLALARAQQARDQAWTGDEAADAWSCPRARQATYALQVGLGAKDHAAVLRDVQAADDAWAAGDPWVYGTWAQVRIGAALAHVMTGDVKDAEAELDPVFQLGNEYRVVTIIGRMGEVGRRLGHSHYKGDHSAADLRERIRSFQSGSLEHRAITPSETS